jgi:hypothetical protein
MRADPRRGLNPIVLKIGLIDKLDESNPVRRLKSLPAGRLGKTENSSSRLLQSARIAKALEPA